MSAGPLVPWKPVVYLSYSFHLHRPALSQNYVRFISLEFLLLFPWVLTLAIYEYIHIFLPRSARALYVKIPFMQIGGVVDRCRGGGSVKAAC